MTSTVTTKKKKTIISLTVMLRRRVAGLLPVTLERVLRWLILDTVLIAIEVTLPVRLAFFLVFQLLEGILDQVSKTLGGVGFGLGRGFHFQERNYTVSKNNDIAYHIGPVLTNDRPDQENQGRQGQPQYNSPAYTTTRAFRSR